MKSVLKKLNKIATLYNLKFKRNIFKVNFINKKDYWTLAFLDGAPIPWIKEFQNPTNRSIKELSKFLSNKYYKKFKNYASGCVASKNYLLKAIRQISNKEIRIKLFKVAKNLKSFKDIAIVVTKPTNKREKQGLNYILLHEFIHTLLIFNKISLQKIKKNYWELDEALVKYLMYEDFFNKNVNRWVLW